MSKIEWTDETINPVVGCQKISNGCLNCYAERFARRLKGQGLWQYQDIVNKSGWTGRVNFIESELEKPLKWKKPRRIFIGSMCDLFYSKHRQAFFTRISKIFYEAPQHTYLILTKRPDEMIFTLKSIYPGSPPPNVWLGVTVEHLSYTWRIEVLSELNVLNKFVSVEPMLSPIDLKEFLPGLDWVICGAETGQGKRELKLEWAIDLQGQCRRAGVPFFFKKDSAGQWPKGLARDLPVKMGF